MRQVHYPYNSPFDPEDHSGDNNNWIYNRAPDGYCFVLVRFDSIASQEDTEQAGILQLYDGHEYTHWNIYPGVQSNEVLARHQHSNYELNSFTDLLGWECKEYTIGSRGISQSYPFRALVIVWYYLKKMSTLDKLHFAVTQPKSILGRFPKAFRTTVEPTEEEG